MSIAVVRTVLAGLLCCSAPSNVDAQTVATPVIGGRPLSCFSAAGEPVVTIVQAQDDAARSTVQGGVPVISLNPIIATYPPPVQWFLYGHECMHHRLGQVSSPLTMQAEKAADCGAVRVLLGQGLLDLASISVIVAYYQQAPVRSAAQPPGPERAANIMACFNTP